MAEVALGKTGPGQGSTTNEKNMLAKGFDSTEDVSSYPDPKDTATLFGDVLVPYGKYKKDADDWNMNIVYNTN